MMVLELHPDDAYLAGRFSVVLQRALRRANRRGLPSQQTLTALRDEGPIKAADLAAVLGEDPAVISTRLYRIKQAGLCERHPGGMWEAV